MTRTTKATTKNAGPDASFMEITPKLAAKWLGRNSHNRAPRKSRIDQYAREMSEGRWHVSQDAITFDRNPDDPQAVLINGQHRLRAVEQSGKTIKAFVVTGLPRESQIAMDVGGRRSLADHLQLLGYRNTTMLASLISRVWMYRHHQHRSDRRPTHQQALDFLRDNPQIEDAQVGWQMLKGRLNVQPAVANACYYLFSEVDADGASDFYSKLASGADLSEGDPVFSLRRYLTRNMALRNHRVEPDVLMALFIKAFNSWRAGKPLRLLAFRPTTEEYPQVLNDAQLGLTSDD